MNSKTLTSFATKFNWGWRIALVYSLFVVGTLGMVAIAMSTKVDLVSDNYYQNAVNYQQSIDRQSNAQSAIVETRQENQILVIGLTQRIDRGTITMFRPSSTTEDFTTAMKLDNHNEQFLDISNLNRGLWIVKMEWSADGKNFQQDKRFFLR